MIVESEAWLRSLEISVDAKLLAMGPDAIVIDPNTGWRHAQLPIETDVFAFSRDGRILATTSDGRVQLWRMPDGKEVTPIASRDDYGFLNSLAISPDGKNVATMTGVRVAPELRLTEIASGELKAVYRQNISRPTH